MRQARVMPETTAAADATSTTTFVTASQLHSVFQHGQQLAGPVEPEVQPRMSPPVVLLDREGQYGVITALGVSIVGLTCVLVYTLDRYGKLKKNVEEERNYIVHRWTKADKLSGGEQVAAAGGTGTSDDGSVSVEISLPPANGSCVDAGSPLGVGRNASDFGSVVWNFSNAFLVAGKQERSGMAAARLHQWNTTIVDTGSGGDS